MSDGFNRNAMIARVVDRGEAIKRGRRLRMLGIAASSLALVVVIAAIVFVPQDDVRQVAPLASADPTSVPTPNLEPTPTAEVSPEPTTLSESPAPTIECYNSYDERCGPFRFEPEPGPNEPLTIDITYEPANPKVGDEITFEIVVRDDSPRGPGLAPPGIMWGDGESEPGVVEGCRLPPKRYGPWKPTEATGSKSIDVYKHTYQEAGEFEVEANYTNDRCGSELDPYVSTGQETVKIPISSAP